MKIFVCIKQVPDTEAHIVPNGAGVDESAVRKWILNPYDEFAVEEAVRLKEAVSDADVVALSLGPPRTKSAFHTALAMGADRAIHIVSDRDADPAQTAKALAAAIGQETEPTVVFTGLLAIDDCACQVHLRLAQQLGASAAIHVSAFHWTGHGAEVTRSAAGRQETLYLPTPTVVAVTRDINKPRYPTLPNIMKAKKKEIRQLSLSDLGLDHAPPSVEVSSLVPQEEFSDGRLLEGEYDAAVPQLVQLLRDEAKVV